MIIGIIGGYTTQYSLGVLRIPGSRLTKAVDQLGEVVRCPNPDCSCALTVDGGRQRWQCCEWPAWCTKCRQPYHYKVECEDVEAEKLVILRVFSDYANVVRNTVGMLLI